MYLPVMSVYDGTWASGGVPEELLDHELMREMHWSWADLEATPLYVRRYTWDCIQARRQAEADRQEKRDREAQRQNRGR